MPAYAIVLIVLAALVGFDAYQVKKMQKVDPPSVEQSQFPIASKPTMVLEPEGIQSPALHPLADPSGIIPAQGEPWPSKPSIFNEGGSNDRR